MNKRLSVLIATPLGKGGKGGIDRIMDEVRRELAENPNPNIDVRFGTTRGAGSIILAPFYLAGMIAFIVWLKARGQIDVLHINLSSHGSVLRKSLIARVARALGVTYVVHLHGSRFRQYWDAAKPWTSDEIGALFSGAAVTLVLGGVWEKFVRDKVPEARLIILHNATRAFAQLDPYRTLPPTILFLGRVGARKGVPELIDALGLISKNHVWRAVIAGDGDLQPARAALERAGIADRVELTGWVDPDAVHQLLLSSGILVLPSHDENLPMSVIEGMSYGLAVVCTPVGAVEEIVINGETGLITPVGSPTALAEALSQLLDDPILRMRLGENARRFHTEHLDIHNYISRLVEIWTTVSVRKRNK